MKNKSLLLIPFCLVSTILISCSTTEQLNTTSTKNNTKIALIEQTTIQQPISNQMYIQQEIVPIDYIREDNNVIEKNEEYIVSDIGNDQTIFLVNNISSYIIKIKAHENPCNPGTFSTTTSCKDQEMHTVELLLHTTPTEYYLWNSIERTATQFTIVNDYTSIDVSSSGTKDAYLVNFDGKNGLVIKDSAYIKGTKGRGLYDIWIDPENDSKQYEFDDTGLFECGYISNKDFIYNSIYDIESDIIRAYTIQTSIKTGKQAIMVNYFYYDRNEDSLYPILYPLVNCDKDVLINKVIKSYR